MLAGKSRRHRPCASNCGAVVPNHVRRRSSQAFKVCHHSAFTASFSVRSRPLATTCAAKSKKSRRDFVPGQDGFLAETQVPAIEPEPCAPRRVRPELFQRGRPAGRAGRVARSPFHVQAQPRARRHADERRMTLAPALVRVVTAGGGCRMTGAVFTVASPAALN